MNPLLDIKRLSAGTRRYLQCPLTWQRLTDTVQLGLLALALYGGNALMSLCFIALDCQRNSDWQMACRFPERHRPEVLSDMQMHAGLGWMAAAWLPLVTLEMVGCVRFSRRWPQHAQRRCQRRLVTALLLLDVLLVLIAAR